MQLPLKQRNLSEESSPSFCAGRKLGDVEQALLWSLLHKAPQCPSRALLAKAAEQHVEIAVSIRHLNRWRAALGLNRPKGRPGQGDGHKPVRPGAEVVRVTPHMSFVGVHAFAHWLDQHHAFARVVARLRQAAHAHKQTHPDDDFALLHHRESTFLHRFKTDRNFKRHFSARTTPEPLKTLLGHPGVPY